MACAPEAEFAQQSQGLSLPSARADNTHLSVIRVFRTSGDVIGTCSGTLIAPRVVLTAAHCVSPGRVGAPQGEFSIANLQARLDDMGFTLPRSARIVARCYIHPRAQLSLAPGREGRFSHSCDEPARTNGTNVDHDLAILVLNQRLYPESAIGLPELHVPVIPPHFGAPDQSAWAARSWDRQAVTFVGWGVSPARRQQPRLMAQAILGAQLVNDVAYYSFAWINNPQQTSNGDSGGPTLGTVEGEERVISVHSSLDNTGNSFDTPIGDDRTEFSNGAFIRQIVDPARTGNVHLLLGSRDRINDAFIEGADPEDPDCDGISTHGNGRDNCPNVANLTQLDTDLDGVGDECDSCLNVASANIENSNEDAESAHGQQRLGDVCDSAIVPRTSRTNAPAVGFGRILGTNTRMRTQSVGTRRLEGTASVGYRFCRCDFGASTVASRARCAADPQFLCDLGSQPRPGHPLFSQPEQSNNDGTILGWGQVRTCGPGGGCGLNARYPLSYTTGRAGVPIETSYNFDWDLLGDFRQFSTAVLEIPVASLRGVFWSHTAAFAPRDGFNDVEGSPFEFSLRSNYLSGTFIQASGLAIYTFNWQFAQPLPFWRLPEPICPFCDGVFPSPQLAVDADRVGVHLATGDLDLTPQITVAARLALNQPELLWLTANDPPSLREGALPVLVAVSTDGSAQIRNSLYASGESLTTGQGGGDVPPSARRVAMRANQGAFALYSTAGALRGVYFVGGTEGVESARSLTVLDPASGNALSTALLSRVRPTIVLSAALSTHNAQLYVIDRSRVRANRVRLFRIDVASGTLELLGSWRDPWRLEWSIAVGWNGELIVSRSSARTPWTRFERLTLDAHGELQSFGVLEREFSILGPITADARGVSFVRRARQGPQIEGIEFDAFLHADRRGQPCQFDSDD